MSREKKTNKGNSWRLSFFLYSWFGGFFGVQNRAWSGSYNYDFSAYKKIILICILLFEAPPWLSLCYDNKSSYPSGTDFCHQPAKPPTRHEIVFEIIGILLCAILKYEWAILMYRVFFFGILLCAIFKCECEDCRTNATTRQVLFFKRKWVFFFLLHSNLITSVQVLSIFVI